MNEQQVEYFKVAVLAIENVDVKDTVIILQMLEHAYLLGKTSASN